MVRHTVSGSIPGALTVQWDDQILQFALYKEAHTNPSQGSNAYEICFGEYNMPGMELLTPACVSNFGIITDHEIWVGWHEWTSAGQ